MDLPRNLRYPFFAYGFFKKGEIAFYSISNYVEESSRDCYSCSCFDKDGIPIISRGKTNKVFGDVIIFNNSEKAYLEIVSKEPGELYDWNEIVTEGGVRVNILMAKHNKVNGASLVDEYRVDWTAKKDSLFCDGMEYLKKRYFSPLLAREYHPYFDIVSEKKSLYTYFELQMGYVFLCTIIERYATLKYRISAERINEKVKCLVEEPFFCNNSEMINSWISNLNIVDVANYRNRSCGINQDLKKIMPMFYQIRHNSVHRGKALFSDYKKLEKAFLVLYAIMANVLSNEFYGNNDKEVLKLMNENIKII